MDLESELPLLSRLRFVVRRPRRGGSWGERRSTRRGSGLEFADYRDYTPGDDPRRVDWNLYARLDRPYVRLYEEEEDLVVTVLLDGSASMGWGEEQIARWPLACRIAQALGTLALLGGDSLRGGILGGTAVTATWGPARGRGHVSAWAAWLETLHLGEKAALGEALSAVALRPGRPGLTLLLTDGYDVPGLRAGLAALAARGHEVVLLHLLTPEELDPGLRGDLRLVDSETGEHQDVTVDGAALAAYDRRLATWRSELRTLAGKHGGRYALLRTDLSLHRIFLEELRHAAVVR